MRHYARADGHFLHLAQLKNQRARNVALLDAGLAQVELAGLAVVVGEAFGPDALFLALHLGGEGMEALLRIFTRAALFAAPRVRLVIHPAFGIAERHVPILLEGGEGALRGIDGQEGEVGRSEPFQLRVEIGEVAALKKRVVREVDAGNDVLGAEGDLLRLGEEVVDAAVKHEAAHAADGNLLLGDDFGGVKHIEVELIGEVLIKKLQAQFPLGESAGLDGIPQVAAMVIRVRAVDLDCLVPEYGLEPELRLPMELHKGRFPLRVDEPEGVNAEAFHEAERARDRTVGHGPHDHVHAFRGQRYKIPEIVVRRCRLGKSPVGLLLGRVNEIRKLDGVLNEEDGDVVANDVPVALFGVELHREAANVAGKVRRALIARYS